MHTLYAEWDLIYTSIYTLLQQSVVHFYGSESEHSFPVSHCLANPLLRLLSHWLDFPIQSFLSWMTIMIFLKKIWHLWFRRVFLELNHIAIYRGNLVFSCKAIIRCKNIPRFCQVWWHNLTIPAPEKLRQNGKEFEANLDCVESSRPPRQPVKSCLNVYPIHWPHQIYAYHNLFIHLSCGVSSLRLLIKFIRMLLYKSFSLISNFSLCQQLGVKSLSYRESAWLDL